MSKRQAIINILDTMHPAEAISLIESIGKERRKANSVAVSKVGIKRDIDRERPDLVIMKRNNER